MAFSFGFHDIDDEDDQDTQTKSDANLNSSTSGPSTESTVPVVEHKLEDLVGTASHQPFFDVLKLETFGHIFLFFRQLMTSPTPTISLVSDIVDSSVQLPTLPERLSYSTVKIESPTGRLLYLPKRELYDVRVQLLLEGPANDAVIDQIEKSDLRLGVYEGGFKTWECSLDLASLLLDRGPRKDIDELVRCDQIVELGAGSALPSLVLFQHCLKSDIPMRFYLADFNTEVLRLVTLPNIILTWAAFSSSPKLPNLDANSKGDLELTPELLQRFTTDMRNTHLEPHFVSGPWSPTLAGLISESGSDMGSVILAAETIYSPESTTAFVDLLATLLKRVKMSKAMIAAKRIYFGVGGSVDGLKEACREHGMVAYEIENHGVPGVEVGVGRALVEVQTY